MGVVSIRSEADIEAIEADGLAAFLPAQSPYDILEQSATQWPDAIALHYLKTVGEPKADVPITYAGLLQRVRQGANLFHRLGLGRSDAVAILMPHVPSGQIALWAAETAGRACPINPMLRPEHIVELVRAAGAKIAVVLGSNGDVDIWNAVVPALRRSGLLTHIRL